MSTIAPNNPPYPAYRAEVKDSFAWDSAVRRWPIIIDSVITDYKKAIDESSNEQAKQEGATILGAIEALKQELANDKPLVPFKDNSPDVESWNHHLSTYFPGATWFNCTWLFSECYLYRRLYECFITSTFWSQYDPFERQKIETFRGSQNAVFELAEKMPTLIQPMTSEQQEIVYHELLQVCLWGNATDLSLLTNMTHEDIKRLQAIEKEHLKEQKKRIVVDDSEKLWQKMDKLAGGRVDFVLDNSGFELFVDLVLADWIIQSGKAKQVVLNCKTIPWFVSDVMPKDIPMLFELCLDRSFFPNAKTEEQYAALETMVKRWQSYVENEQIVVRADPFWCTGLPYWFLKSESPELFDDLKRSDLVIFKGDLNFRKLVFCCDWPVTTPFKTAIGPELSTRFTDIVALRTNKAEVVVGLAEGKKEEIEKNASYLEWRCSGKYAVVEYNQCQ